MLTQYFCELKKPGVALSCLIDKSGFILHHYLWKHQCSGSKVLEIYQNIIKYHVWSNFSNYCLDSNFPYFGTSKKMK